MTLTSSAPQSIIGGVGEFSYTMDAQGGPIGGNTIVSINANHNFDGIVPRYAKVLNSPAAEWGLSRSFL